jgi:hypothetical protein
VGKLLADNGDTDRPLVLLLYATDSVAAVHFGLTFEIRIRLASTRGWGNVVTEDGCWETKRV